MNRIDKDMQVSTETQKDYLLRVAGKYIWWKSPEDAIKYPQTVLARVMNIGIWDDLCELAQIFSGDELRSVLKSAETGQFNDRSWHYWHYLLMDCTLDNVPEPPVRRSN